MAERMQALARPCRARPRCATSSTRRDHVSSRSAGRSCCVASVRDDGTTPQVVGRTVADLAGETSADALDTFLDLALAEDLETVFVIDRPVSQEDRDVIRFLLRHPLTMPGSSDGGAHVNTFCGADYTTTRAHRVRRRRVHLRAGRAALSAVPAATVGLWDRGEIRPGAAADLVLLDRAASRSAPLACCATSPPAPAA